MTATPWLERLLLRLGPSASARDLDTGEDLGVLASAAAGRILERYREGAAHGESTARG